MNVKSPGRVGRRPARVRRVDFDWRVFQLVGQMSVKELTAALDASYAGALKS